MRRQNIDTCPKILPAMVPVNKCKAKPIKGAAAESMKPSDIPIIPKNEPGGVWEITSIETNNPEIPQDAMKPAREQ